MQRKPARKANYPTEFVPACKTGLRNFSVRTQQIERERGRGREGGRERVRERW